MTGVPASTGGPCGTRGPLRMRCAGEKGCSRAHPEVRIRKELKIPAAACAVWSVCLCVGEKSTPPTVLVLYFTRGTPAVALCAGEASARRTPSLCNATLTLLRIKKMDTRRLQSRPEKQAPTRTPRPPARPSVYGSWNLCASPLCIYSIPHV